MLLAYLYAHYLFASTTAHITAMFGAFYAAGIALGAPPMVFALIMAAASSLMMTLTHYATGTSPIIFNSGYTTLGQWWLAGLVMSAVNLVVWIVIGGVWCDASTGKTIEVTNPATGKAIGTDTFGLSAPGDVVMKELGITKEAVIAAAKAL